MKNNQKAVIAAAVKSLAGAAMALALRTSIDIHIDPYNVRFSVNFDRRRIALPDVGKTDKDESGKPDQKSTA